MGSHRTLVAALATLLGLALAGPAPADDGRGEVLFGYCSQCHGENGGGNPLALAPAIAGLSDWYVEAQLHKFRDGIRGGHPDDLAGLRMRPMSRTLQSDEDVKIVSRYVANLPRVPQPRTLEGDPERGKPLYTACGACHGADGKGNKQLNGPALVHLTDWYMLTQLSNFKAGIRGGNPSEDMNGGLMRPMAMQLADEQAMKDVIAHIKTLGQ